MRLVGSIDGDAVPTEPPSASEYERFDVLLAQQGERQLESALKIQRYALLPSLILGYKADPMLNGPQDNSVWDKDNWHQSSGALSITLSWSLDALLPASAIRVAKAEVQDRLSLARAAEAFALRAGRDEAASQERDLRDGVDRIANLSNVADAAKRAYELTNAAYQLGAGRFLDLQDSEVAWQGARMQLLAERLKLAALVFDFEAKFRSR
jgi:outer membrane protein TolC